RSHPGIGSRLLWWSHVDEAIRRSVLVDKQNIALRLHDLERIRHIGCARNSGHVALRLRIFGHALCEVIIPFLLCFRFVWNFATFNDGLTRGDCANCPGLPEWAGLRWMIQQIPICSVHRLPNAIQVWATSETRCTVCLCLGDGWNHRYGIDKKIPNEAHQSSCHGWKRREKRRWVYGKLRRRVGVPCAPRAWIPPFLAISRSGLRRSLAG